MQQLTLREKTSYVVESLLRATQENRLSWTVEHSDGVHFGCYRTTARDYEFRAEYQTGSKAFTDVSILVEGDWVSLGMETDPVVHLLDLLQLRELEQLADDIVAAARMRQSTSETRTH